MVPAGFCAGFIGCNTPGPTRTVNLSLRRRMLCPIELQVQISLQVFLVFSVVRPKNQTVEFLSRCSIAVGIGKPVVD